MDRGTGIVIREARVEDAAEIARVHVDSWRATYPGIVPDEVLAAQSYERRQEVWERTLRGEVEPTFVYVAEEAGRIVGFASGGPARDGDPEYQGELYAIYLLPGAQGRGIGRLLVRAVAERLASAGMEAMLVWVLAENPARAFYEKLGGQFLRTQPLHMGDTVLEEVAYGWTDTRILRGLAGRR